MKDKEIQAAIERFQTQIQKVVEVELAILQEEARRIGWKRVGRVLAAFTDAIPIAEPVQPRSLKTAKRRRWSLKTAKRRRWPRISAQKVAAMRELIKDESLRWRSRRGKATMKYLAEVDGKVDTYLFLEEGTDQWKQVGLKTILYNWVHFKP